MVNTRRYILLFVGTMALIMSAVVVAADDYHLSTGDVLSISVFNEPDLSLDEVRVTTTGVISFPLLGEVKVVNLSSTQVEQRLIEMLLDGYLKRPRVTVSIKEYRLFYVHGEVKSPGGYNYQDGLTVRKAVVLAGGFTERAAKGKVTLVTEAEAASLREADADFGRVDEMATMVGLNHLVRPGDVITIGESFF
ncbi:hypothetical protein MNBD_GAMMA26-2622 [hydrothermal vent metagenome]|uniref:Uncharacterized protein n=1 Tax=hydrothermal vent metagenome TaxID=652676 RepID=A0A3B1BRL4_9ZZZZ